MNILNELELLLNKKLDQATTKEVYFGLLAVTKKQIDLKEQLDGDKKVYYISSEFLIGKLLSNNLINLGVYKEVKELLAENGHDITTIEEFEPEPSLGNGGLGRLAACFIDSIASLGLPADGVGILYHFGLFKQVFENNKQTTQINPWLAENSWVTKTDETFKVDFSDFSVNARLNYIDVVGFNQGVNKLKLFDIESVDESIVKSGINFDKTDIKSNLTLFLYPDDSDENGELLRIYQQYFMVSAAAQMILKEVKAKGFDLNKLNEHAVIQINDTHPSLVIPELIRLLQLESISLEDAIEIVKKTTAYTNHTILAEALEKWPLRYLEQVVPHLVDIIKHLDKLVKTQFKDPKVQIIDEQQRVHMAHMDIHFGFSVNGVAALHTDILKQSELSHFNEIYPDKFNNKTNGITFRRWLLHCNPELTSLIESKIGTDFHVDALELKKLMDYKDDTNFIKEMQKIKYNNKVNLSQYVMQKEQIEVDPNSIFDIQIKRLHEYKRQQMNVLYIINKYLEIQNGILPKTPITFFFGAKAAPAYTIAQDIIHLILCLQKIVNEDPITSKYIKIVMLENYNVTVAEKLIPACDVSEQISLASKEASGTGNMKFMLNGAITLGTADGANVEIGGLVGDENIYTFGKDSDTIIELYKTSGYVAKDFYDDAEIKTLVDFIISPKLAKVGDMTNLKRLHNELIVKDWFMTLIDLKEYIAVKDQMFDDYTNQEKWAQMQLVNISQAGFFSSDRTIADYNKDIWKLK